MYCSSVQSLQSLLGRPCLPRRKPRLGEGMKWPSSMQPASKLRLAEVRDHAISNRGTPGSWETVTSHRLAPGTSHLIMHGCAPTC